MRAIMIIGFCLGGLGFTALLVWYGAAAIGRATLAVAWVLPLCAGIQLLQLLLAGHGWRALLPATEPAPGSCRFLWLRWIRESVNTLLPVAQIGGEVVGARLLARDGVRIAVAGASAVADLSAEFVSLVLFALAGCGLLVLIRPGHDLGGLSGGLGLSALAGVALVAVQRAGLLFLVETGIERFAARFPALVPLRITGMHEALMRIHRNRRGLGLALFYHCASWCLGAAEACLVLFALGHPVDPVRGFVIESLGQAARSLGFAIPGGLGIQEGGLILAAGLLGIPAETALALSMIKRARELVLGVPGLLSWQWAEGRHLFGLARR